MIAALLCAALVGADEPAKPAAGGPPPLFRKKSAAPKAEAGKQADAPRVGEDRPIPKPAAKLGDGDEEVLRDLGRDPNLDKGADPLLRAGDGMRKAEEQLAKLAADDATLSVQDQVVKDLEELLKQSEDSQQQQQQQQQKKKKKQKKPQPKDGKQSRNAKQPQQADQQSKADRAAQKPGGARLTAVELAAMRERRDVWGHLPEAERQLLEQAAREEKLPEFQAALEKYYSKIAEESSGKNGKNP